MPWIIRIIGFFIRTTYQGNRSTQGSWRLCCQCYSFIIKRIYQAHYYSYSDWISYSLVFYEHVVAAVCLSHIYRLVDVCLSWFANSFCGIDNGEFPGYQGGCRQSCEIIADRVMFEV